MRIKIDTFARQGGGWFMRRYLNGRTCKVLAVQKKTLHEFAPTSFSYFVLHPITKKPGYWVPAGHCKIIVHDPQPPTWDAFLECNDYGYSK